MNLQIQLFKKTAFPVYDGLKDNFSSFLEKVYSIFFQANKAGVGHKTSLSFKS